MGFNIGIGIIDANNQIDTSCDVFLDRTYYNLISEYLYESKTESCLYHISKDLEIDIEPLTDIIYLGDEDFIPANLYLIIDLIDLVAKFKNHIKDNSSIIWSKPNKKNQNWKKYVDEDLEKHLELILQSLKCFQEKKYEKVFFWYG